MRGRTACRPLSFSMVQTRAACRRAQAGGRAASLQAPLKQARKPRCNAKRCKPKRCNALKAAVPAAPPGAISREEYDKRVKACWRALLAHRKQHPPSTRPFSARTCCVHLLADYLLARGLPPGFLPLTIIKQSLVSVDYAAKTVILPGSRRWIHLEDWRNTKQPGDLEEVWGRLLAHIHPRSYLIGTPELERKLGRIRSADFPVIAPTSMPDFVVQWRAKNVPSNRQNVFQAWFDRATTLRNGISVDRGYCCTAQEELVSFGVHGLVVYKWLAKVPGSCPPYATPWQRKAAPLDSGECEDQAVLCRHGLHFCVNEAEAQAYLQRGLRSGDYVLVECLVVTPFVHCQKAHKCVAQALWIGHTIVREQHK